MEGPGGAHRVHVELRRIFGMPAILRHGSRLGGRLDGMVKMWQGSNESIMSQLREHYIWEVDVCTHTHTHTIQLRPTLKHSYPSTSLSSQPSKAQATTRVHVVSDLII